MRTKEIKIYLFDELSEKAQEKAIENNREWNVNYDWWDLALEDFSSYGITVEEFDLGRSWDIKLKIEDAEEAANKIISSWGEGTPFYTTASEFLQDIKSARRDAAEGELLDDLIDDLIHEFTKELGEEILGLLRADYEYLTSDEAISESLSSNGCEFYEDGRDYY